MTSIVRFGYISASAKLTVWDDEHATLSNVYSIYKRRGHASRVMQDVANYADLHNLTVLLEVEQYADAHGLDNNGLKRFYAKFGFVALDEKFMQRDPSQKLQAS